MCEAYEVDVPVVCDQETFNNAVKPNIKFVKWNIDSKTNYAGGVETYTAPMKDGSKILCKKIHSRIWCYYIKKENKIEISTSYMTFIKDMYRDIAEKESVKQESILRTALTPEQEKILVKAYQHFGREIPTGEQT